ncbi:hypothetical protein NCS52_00259300 [Fusarium sp. LHS14.1]|nr:hypothetical protein NCS52_00259300 [Fusarium sp. LHS14.1]
MSTEGRPKMSPAEPLQEQQQRQRQQNQNADSTLGSNKEILIKLKSLGLEDQLSLTLLAKFKELRLQDRPYFAPPSTAQSTPEERARAWSAEYCGYWSPSWDDSIHPYCRPLPSTIPPGTECPSQRPTNSSIWGMGR